MPRLLHHIKCDMRPYSFYSAFHVLVAGAVHNFMINLIYCMIMGNTTNRNTIVCLSKLCFSRWFSFFSRLTSPFTSPPQRPLPTPPGPFIFTSPKPTNICDGRSVCVCVGVCALSAWHGRGYDVKF